MIVLEIVKLGIILIVIVFTQFLEQDSVKFNSTYPSFWVRFSFHKEEGSQQKDNHALHRAD